MPTHIDQVVTEVIPEPESRHESGDGDKRWQESMQVEAILKQSERKYRRICAGGFDD